MSQHPRSDCMARDLTFSGNSISLRHQFSQFLFPQPGRSVNISVAISLVFFFILAPSDSHSTLNWSCNFYLIKLSQYGKVLEEKWGLNIHPCSAPMITRRRRTRSSGEDSDQTRVEFSSENDFNLVAVDMTTCRDRTSEFISAVKSLQSRQVNLEMSMF